MSAQTKVPDKARLAIGDLLFTRPLSARVPSAPVITPWGGRPAGHAAAAAAPVRLVGGPLQIPLPRTGLPVPKPWKPLPRPIDRSGPAGVISILLESDPGVLSALSKLARRALPRLPGASDLGVVGGLYIGHVGLVDIDDSGNPWVVESAFREDGVHLIDYDEWLARRQADGCAVWQARLQRYGSDIDQDDGAEMLKVAHLLRMRRTHYEIFDHNPDRWLREPGDSTNVYCSELPLICADAIGIDLIPRRGPLTLLPLVGPKRLSESTALRWLNEPAGLRY